jgi:hypothetical protein
MAAWISLAPPKIFKSNRLAAGFQEHESTERTFVAIARLSGLD